MGVSFHLYLDTYLKAYLYNIHLDILLLAKEGRTLQKYEAYAWWNVPMKCLKFFYCIWFYLVVSNSTIWLKNEEQKELCFCNQKTWQVLKDFAGIFHPAYVYFFWRVKGKREQITQTWIFEMLIQFSIGRYLYLFTIFDKRQLLHVFYLQFNMWW